MEIRSSLNYSVYVQHSQSIKFAADEMNRAFFENENKNEPNSEEKRLKGLGYLDSSLMLYAVSIELILKAYALNFEIAKDENRDIKTFDDFFKKFKKPDNKNGHKFNPIIEKYQISLTTKQKETINKLQDYSVWAGRFPFPKYEEGIIKLENTNGAEGASIGLSLINDVQEIINSVVHLINEINDN